MGVQPTEKLSVPQLHVRLFTLSKLANTGEKSKSEMERRRKRFMELFFSPKASHKRMLSISTWFNKRVSSIFPETSRLIKDKESRQS